MRGERVSGRVWLGIAISMAGALLLTGADLRVSTDALLGDGLALLGGIFAAAYMTVGSEVRRSVTTLTYTTVCYSTTALLLLATCVVGRQSLSGYDGLDWLRLAALTVGAQLLGHSLFNVVLRTVNPTVVSLSILFEIPGAAVIAALFVAGQHVPLLAIPAAALLVAGLAVVISDSRRVSAPVE
jgi:drug/metabolite transporter (DMT)-like permease